MTTTRKLLGMGAASLLVMAAILTTVPATMADDDGGHGNLSRTFMYWGNVEWKVPPADDKKEDPELGGVGWYDPDGPVCLFSLFGLRFGSGIYYDTLRITTNAVENHHLAHVGKTMVSVPCPLDPLGTDNHKIGTSAFNVFASPGVTQSHLLCLDASVEQICTPDPQTAQWVLHVCKDVTGVSFEPGNILGTGLGSSSVTGLKKDDPTCRNGNAYDATDYLDNATARQSGFTPLHLDQLWTGKTKTDESTYVVSCYTIDYTKFPSPKGTAQSQDFTAKSHDWFLVLKNDGNTVTDLAHHLLGPHLLQGLYDLSGSNGCPFQWEGTELDSRDKDKDNPEVIVPGLGNVDLL